jgi:hypothetical protein
MKNIAILLLIVFGVGLVSSCKKEPKEPILDMNLTKAAEITAPVGQEIILLKEQADSTIHFVWTAAEYNLSDLETIKYLLQMDTLGGNFENPVELTSNDTLTFSITVAALNNKLIAAGIPADSTRSVAFRVLSYINNTTDFTNAASGIVNNSFTTYESGGPADYPKLYVPGDYQGWNPAEAPNVYDFDGDGIYTGYIYFPEGGTYEFKFTSDPDWEHTNYGAGASDGTLDTDPGAGNLIVPGPGGYNVAVDINELTWTYELQNWGVIGEWLSWAEDIDMIYDPVEQQLSVTVEDIPAADNQRFKFRANDDWAVNLGANDPDDGTLVPNGADIPIPDGGTLTFILRFTTPEPTYEVISGK